MERFWMVYVEDKASPRHKHTAFELAKAEAERLAIVEGERAYVLEAVGYARPTTVWESLTCTKEE